MRNPVPEGVFAGALWYCYGPALASLNRMRGRRNTCRKKVLAHLRETGSMRESDGDTDAEQGRTRAAAGPPLPPEDQSSGEETLRKPVGWASAHHRKRL